MDSTLPKTPKLAWLRILRYVALGSLWILVGFMAGVWSHLDRGSSQPLKDMGPAPSYILTNQIGLKINSQEFLGKVQIVTFLFPYCTTDCPLIAAHLIGFEHLLSQLGVQNRVVITSFNLAPDSAGLVPMRKFLSQYGWNPSDPHWQFLTGPPAQIRRVVTQGFHIFYQRVSDVGNDSEVEISSDGEPQLTVANPLAEKANPGFDISHNDALILVDPKGHIRKIYTEADVVSNQQLWNDLQSLFSK